MTSKPIHFHHEFMDLLSAMKTIRRVREEGCFYLLFKKIYSLFYFNSLFDKMRRFTLLIIFYRIINNTLTIISGDIPILFSLQQMIPSNREIFVAILANFATKNEDHNRKKLLRHRKKFALKKYFKFRDMALEKYSLFASSLITKLDFEKQLRSEASKLIHVLSSLTNHEYEDFQSYDILTEFILRLHKVQELDLFNHNSRDFFRGFYKEMLQTYLFTRIQNCHIIERAIRKL